MDCHEEDTHFSLLGIFKQDQPYYWIEQLFKHEGYCLWGQDQAGSMIDTEGYWPVSSCIQSDVTGEQGPIYYRSKPLMFGGMTLGLYSDSSCMVDYKGKVSVQAVLGDADSDLRSLYTNLKDWEKLFGYYRTCQPCVTYNRANVKDFISRGLLPQSGQNNRKLQNQGQGHGDDPFYCYDRAGYENVNQVSSSLK